MALFLLLQAVFLSCVMVSHAQDSVSEMIAFPSGIRFSTVVPDDAKTSKDSYLFDANGVENKKLSLSYKVSAFKHASQDQFRADPVLFSCVQKVQNAMQKVNERVEIVSGYVPGASGNHHDEYQSTGAAIRIQLKSGGSLTLEDLTKAAVKSCVPVFQEINRDIGLALFTDKLQIHIQGPEEAGPYYFTDSGVSTDLEALALNSIDEAYDLAGTAVCAADSPSLSAGEIFPDTVSTIEEAVGGLDIPIARTDTVDFSRLFQYPARLIEFENTEGSAGWCGAEGTACVDCTSKIAGSTLTRRCADRTMSPRLLRSVRSLGKATSNEWDGIKLKVLEAWDEGYEGAADGDQPEGSLHFEGRAAKITTSDGDASKLTRLSALAICAGIDAVQHNTDHLVIAALKQKGTTARTVAFSDNQEMVECDAPDTKAHMYTLREEFSETEAKAYPLLDSGDRHDFKLAQEVTLGMFVPRDGRYLRLSPLIVSCLQSVILSERKYEVDPPLQVCRSYYNRMEVESEIDIFDKRYPAAGLGLSIELSFDCNATDTTPLDLYEQMQTVTEQCAPIFYRADGKSMGVGLYNRFVHVDVRPNFKAWAANDDLREGATETEFLEYYQRWYTRAIQGRIVDPDDINEACQASVKPERQNVDFVHEFANKTFDDEEDDDPNKCVPKDDTAFCTSTQVHRNTEVTRIWTEVTRKHLLHDKDELHDALQKCIGSCGTCQEGTFWKMKQEHCNNFLHWVPFNFLNDYTEDLPGDDVNFYLLENLDLKYYACDRHCLVKSPLYSLMVPTLEKLYRPDPQASVQENLYSIANNPSPVFELMHRIYAMSAKGIVKVWVKNEKELITMKDPMKYVFLYNKNVTKVEVYVAQSPNIDIVSGVLQTFFAEWTKQGCLDYSRKFLPPYTVAGLPAHMSKRSVQFDLREQMLHRHRTWEDRWLNGHPLL